VKRNLGLQLAAPLLAIGFAMLVSAIMLSFTEYSAAEVLRVIVRDGFSRNYLVDTVNRAAPYYIAGVAVAIAFKMNLFYIGVEGAYRLAALMAAAAGAAVTLPAVSTSRSSCSWPWSPGRRGPGSPPCSRPPEV
jgi:general nucleoside transport system permease protein